MLAQGDRDADVRGPFRVRVAVGGEQVPQQLAEPASVLGDGVAHGVGRVGILGRRVVPTRWAETADGVLIEWVTTGTLGGAPFELRVSRLSASGAVSDFPVVAGPRYAARSHPVSRQRRV